MALAAGAVTAAIFPGRRRVRRPAATSVGQRAHHYRTQRGRPRRAVHIVPMLSQLSRSFRVESTNIERSADGAMLGPVGAGTPRPSPCWCRLGSGITAGALAKHPEVNRVVICRASRRRRRRHRSPLELRGSPAPSSAGLLLLRPSCPTREKFDIITPTPPPLVRGNSVLSRASIRCRAGEAEPRHRAQGCLLRYQRGALRSI